MTARGLVAALALLAAPSAAGAQTAFYRDTSVFAFTLRADFRALFGDRDTSDAPWREGRLTWQDGAGAHSVAVRLRTRGAFRLRHCQVPPIRLRFDQDSVRGTALDALRRPKLATHCMDRDEYEQYVLQEYAIYRVLALLTPMVPAVRLVRVTWEDATGAVRPGTHYGFMSEDPERMAERLGGELLAAGLPLSLVEPASAVRLALFEYFVGNTDWSVPGLHNVALLRRAGEIHAIPYDFDWSGVISARYARPAPQLPTRTVRERIWRGRCHDAAALEPHLAQLESIRDSLAGVYRAVPGLAANTTERALRYYEEFFRAATDRARFARDVVARDCRP